MPNTQSQIFRVVNLEQGTQEWLDWRHSGIGASDASTVMGDNRFKSASELMYQKRNRINTPPNEAMRLGTSLEPDARALYIEKTGMLVKPQCLQLKKYPWMIASMDGITDDYGHIVEIKCGQSAYRQAERGIVPSYYYGQLQHQLMITGLDSVDYWCYWPRRKGLLQKVTRDDPYIERMLRAEKDFIEELTGECAEPRPMTIRIGANQASRGVGIKLRTSRGVLVYLKIPENTEDQTKFMIPNQGVGGEDEIVVVRVNDRAR